MPPLQLGWSAFTPSWVAVRVQSLGLQSKNVMLPLPPPQGHRLGTEHSGLLGQQGASQSQAPVNCGFSPSTARAELQVGPFSLKQLCEDKHCCCTCTQGDGWSGATWTAGSWESCSHGFLTVPAPTFICCAMHLLQGDSNVPTDPEVLGGGGVNATLTELLRRRKPVPVLALPSAAEGLEDKDECRVHAGRVVPGGRGSQ